MGGKTPEPKKQGLDRSKPFKGSKRCTGCKLFFKEEYMIEVTRESGRFNEDGSYKQYYCKECGVDIDRGDITRSRYDTGTDGFGWSRY